MQEPAQEQLPITINPAVEEAVTSVNVGPVSINYGNIWLDVLAGSAVVLLVVIGYYWKKKIDKKFK